MDSRLHFVGVEPHACELHRRAEDYRQAAGSSKADADASPSPSVVIRPASVDDEADLIRLAQLERRRVPEGDILVAAVEGELLAALPLGDGSSLPQPLADPFRPTAMLVDLLWLRAAHLRGDGLPGPRRRRRRGSWMRSLLRRPRAPLPSHAPASPGNCTMMIR
jgi:hypothetical protein